MAIAMMLEVIQVKIMKIGNKGQTSRPNFDTDKVDGYKSEYFDSSDPMSFIDTSYGFDEDDAQRVKSSDKYYNPMVPFDDFVVGLRFENFEIYMVKKYEFEHSCLPTTKNKKVIASMIARKYGEKITTMPFIKPRHLRALVRKDLGVRVSFSVCRVAKLEVIKKIEEKYKGEYFVLNDYVEELKLTNLESTIFVTSHKPTPDLMPVFKKIYICFEALKQSFLEGCRHMIGLDGCFLKGLIKGQLLMAVGRDGNNQMFPIALAVVEN
ncbi:hypothetical protein QQP08_019017 [Theobroma cacao]|nr:hypothetical protein QQP08_019017 [Theobroma cacao]